MKRTILTVLGTVTALAAGLVSWAEYSQRKVWKP